MNADPDNQYFSDGLSEELINALTQLGGLRVAARTSAFRFRGRDVDIREIGRQLNVAAVLEGSVRRAGTRLRITAQLLNVADGYHLWSERYDRELDNVFEIQDDITTSIVRALEPTLLGRHRPLVERHSTNVEAFEQYLKGQQLWYQRTPQSLRAAVASFQAAIRIDPNYALAHAGLAASYGLFLATRHRFDEALGRTREATTLDPLSPFVHGAGACAMYTARRYEDAIRLSERALELHPDFTIGLWTLGLTHSRLGHHAHGCAVREDGVPVRASIAPWLKARGVALMGSDAAADVTPSLVEGVNLPVHVLTIAALGMNLFDNQDLEAVAETAAKLNRWEFMLSVAPMPVDGGTGFPVNGLATF